MSIATLVRSEILRPGTTGMIRWPRKAGGVTQLHYTVTGERDHLILELRFSGRESLVRTQVHVEKIESESGLDQWWFRCPSEGGRCGRQVGKLFLTGYDDLVACRHCRHLRYEWVKSEDREEDEDNDQ